MTSKIHDSVNDIYNIVILLAKQYLYKSKCLKKVINVRELQAELDIVKKYEAQVAIKKGKTYLHNIKCVKVFNYARLLDWTKRLRTYSL